MLALNFNPFPTLTTDRLVLRQLTHNDKHEIFFLRSDAAVLKYLDKYPSPSVEEAVAYIDRINHLITENESVLWGITLKDDPQIIGTICYWRIMKEHFRAEVGYVLQPTYHGKGIMHEAISTVIKYGFDEMKLHSIEARVNTQNDGSIKLLERNGFVREAYFREDYYFDGRFLDTGVYSLLTPHL